jgi:FkbM family methyltransferase
MPRSLSDALTKGIEYLSLPLQYPSHFGSLAGKIFTDRTLVHELPRLTPHRDWLRSARIRTVIDVGGFIGSFAYAARTILPEAQIYSFEPLEDNYFCLVKNLSPLGHFQAFRTALGDRSGTIEFNRSDFAASSSILEMGELHRKAFPQTAHQVKVTVPLARLDDYLDRMELKERTLLKVDVQGYEMFVLNGAARLLPHVDYLLTEVSYQPLYDGQPLFGDIYTFLSTQAFQFAGNFDSMFSPLDGSILQSDALFIRKESK